MATILKLTLTKKETPVRVNFDLVTHYYATSNGTETLFLGERYHQERVKVKETPEEIDRALQSWVKKRYNKWAAMAIVIKTKPGSQYEAALRKLKE